MAWRHILLYTYTIHISLKKDNVLCNLFGSNQSHNCILFLKIIDNGLLNQYTYKRAILCILAR